MLNGTALTTGWGDGLESLPANAHMGAAGRRLLPLSTPTHDDRLRRATRECAFAIMAVEDALRESTLSASDLAGPHTGLVYASAFSYAAANWAFLHADTSSVMYFPYTSPSAVPGEVTIYFNMTGPYLSFLSGANAGLEALWQATRLLATDQCDRVLVLVAETCVECEELYMSGRRFLDMPLVETVLCWILERPAMSNPPIEVEYRAGNGDNTLAMLEHLIAPHPPASVVLSEPTQQGGHRMAQRLRECWPATQVLVTLERIGNCLAAAPLIGLQLAMTEGRHEQIVCISRWGDSWSMLHWPPHLHHQDASHSQIQGHVS